LECHPISSNPWYHYLVARTVSTDELLGVKVIKQQRDPQYAALWRRLKKIESLPKRDQKALLHYLDALVQKNVAAG